MMNPQDVAACRELSAYKICNDPRVVPWTGPFICWSADLHFLSSSEKNGHSPETTLTEDGNRSR